MRAKDPCKGFCAMYGGRGFDPVVGVWSISVRALPALVQALSGFESSREIATLVEAKIGHVRKAA